MGPTIRIGREILCLPYVGFLSCRTKYQYLVFTMDEYQSEVALFLKYTKNGIPCISFLHHSIA